MLKLIKLGICKIVEALNRPELESNLQTYHKRAEENNSFATEKEERIHITESKKCIFISKEDIEKWNSPLETKNS